MLNSRLCGENRDKEDITMIDCKHVIFGLVVSVFFAIVANLTMVQKAAADEVVIRVIGGESKDYKDKDGNVWFDGDKQAYDKNGWGGYLGGNPPSTTVGQNNAVAKNETRYDDFLFKNCTHGLNGRTYRFNLKNGEYIVNFLFCEHWASKRGFSIKINGNYVLENYTLQGPDHTAIVEQVEGIKVTQGYIDIYWESAPATGAPDQNPIFSAIEIVQVTTPVNPLLKLSTTWGWIKSHQ
jgi:hypothetical protein